MNDLNNNEFTIYSTKFCSSQYTRTSSDIKSMIKLAKLNEKHLTELTQVVYYGDMENNPDWKLLELNGALQAAIEEGQVLSFKGITFIHSHIQMCPLS